VGFENRPVTVNTKGGKIQTPYRSPWEKIGASGGTGWGEVLDGTEKGCTFCRPGGEATCLKPGG